MASKVFVDSEHCTNYYNKLINYIYEIERYFLPKQCIQNYIYLKTHENNEFKRSDYIHAFMKLIIQIEIVPCGFILNITTYFAGN